MAKRTPKSEAPAVPEPEAEPTVEPAVPEPMVEPPVRIDGPRIITRPNGTVERHY